MKTILRSTKGQAASEYLVTYAWALLIVIGVIGLLYYFGIGNVTDPHRCTLITGLMCYDFSISKDEFEISLFNNLGSKITINNIELDNCASIPFDVDIGDNRRTTFTVSCAPVPIPVGKYEGELIVTYTKDSLQHSVRGEVLSRIN